MSRTDWLAISICLAIAWLFPALGERWIRPVEKAFSRLAANRSRAILVAFLATIVLRLALLPLIPVPVPGVHDEFSYLLQADTFAHGRLANPPHPMWISFETMHVNWFPTYSSLFPPAQPFVLAVGQLLGHPWIGVLLSCGGMVAAVVWMLQGWMPPRWALLGGMVTLLRLGVTSYWVNSYWGGTVAAAGGALVAGAIPRILRRPRLKDALILGFGLSILANSRPLEGFIFCFPSAIVLLVWLWRDSNVPREVKIRRVALPLCLILVLIAAFTLFYDWRLTGNPFLLPHSLNYKTYSTRLFVWDKDQPMKEYRNPQFDVYYNGWVRDNYQRSWGGFLYVSHEKIEAYESVFFWRGALPLLIFAPFALAQKRTRLLTLTLALSVVALFLVIWWLPHYAAPLVCVIYAVLIQSLRRMRALRFSGQRVGLGLARAIILFLFAATAIRIYVRVRRPTWDWNGDMGLSSRAEVQKKLERMAGMQLAIVRYGPNHNVHEEWVYNRADIDGSKVVWAREIDAQQDARLLAYFRDRRVWLVTPDNGEEYLAPYTPKAQEGDSNQ